MNLTGSAWRNTPSKRARRGGLEGCNKKCRQRRNEGWEEVEKRQEFKVEAKEVAVCLPRYVLGSGCILAQGRRNPHFALFIYTGLRLPFGGQQQ